MNFYGLLHISDEGRHSPNLKARSSPAAISSYVANAVTLANSLRAVGCDFTVVTNDEARLTEINGAGLGANVAVTEISFGTRVPKDILFYSAHHKVDVYRWFSTFAADDYPVLIDLDMVALRPPSTAFIACVSSGIPLVYDISDQVFPVFGEDTIAADLERLLGPQVPLRRWYGGEFTGGRPEFFAKLVEEIYRLWDAYISSFATFHHQGDEVLTSAALCKMLSEGWSALDAGPIGGVGRYWSGQPLHPQKPFAWVEQCFLAHLPGDKAYLAARAHRRPFRGDVFRREYRWHRLAVEQKSRVRSLAKLALGRRRPAIPAG